MLISREPSETELRTDLENYNTAARRLIIITANTTAAPVKLATQCSG